MSFMDKLIDGEAKAEDVEDYVHKWNSGASPGTTLPEYLGLSKDEWHIVRSSGEDWTPSLRILVLERRRCLDIVQEAIEAVKDTEQLGPLYDVRNAINRFVPPPLTEQEIEAVRAGIESAKTDKLRQPPKLSDVLASIKVDSEEDGRWIADCEALPGVMAYGAEPPDAVGACARLACVRLEEMWDERQDDLDLKYIEQARARGEKPVPWEDVKRKLFEPDPRDADELQTAFEAVERGDVWSVEKSAAYIKWMETGEGDEPMDTKE